MKSIDRQILRIALPSIVSNITVPLLGLVDTAIVGHMGDAVYIGAVAVGSMMFNVVYWIFGFLRMGTSGMTAQALGRDDRPETVRLLLRSLAVALAVALGMIVLQVPLRELALWIIGPTADVGSVARTYFNVCIWGAPAVLCLNSLAGWFVGMQNTRVPMYVAILQNVVNIVASLCFVFVLGWGIKGVALGTLLAQYAGLAVAAWLWWRRHGAMWCMARWTGLFDRTVMGRFFSVNADIFLRTVCMVAVNLYFLSAGAAQGAVLLAVNTLLMQLFTLFSYVMDGFAFAGEAICGQAAGAHDEVGLRRSIRRLFGWGAALTAVYTLVYTAGGQPFLSLLTDADDVVVAASAYLPWAVLIPVAGVAAFIWDGVFVGLTATRGMLLASALAALVFFALETLLAPQLGNHALWLAFLSYLFVRGAVQTVVFVRRK